MSGRRIGAETDCVKGSRVFKLKKARGEMNRLFVLVTAVVMTSNVCVAEESRFISQVKLPSGETVVVAEGDNEGRSTGSFSVRLYDAAEPEDATTFFAAGLIEERDGTVEKVILADIDGDKKEEVVVQIRSAGTGGYLSAQAFGAKDKKLQPKGKVEGLAPEADTVVALRNSLKKKG